MAPMRKNALKVCVALAEKEGLFTTVKDHSTIPYFSGFTTLLSVVFFGPLGYIPGLILGYLGALWFLSSPGKSKATVLTESVFGSIIMMLCTFVCGLIWGRLGLYIGSLIALIFICTYSSPQFKPSRIIIEDDMNDEEKLRLGKDAQNILSSVDVNDIDLMLLILSKCPELKKALINQINLMIKLNRQRIMLQKMECCKST